MKLVWLVVVLAASTALAQQPGAMPFPNYLDGLDALEEGRWDDAQAQFAKAIERDIKKPEYHAARTVALLFGEKPDEAGKELDEAQRLRPDDVEAGVWRQVIAVMRGGAPAKTGDAYVRTMLQLAARYASKDSRAVALADSPRHAAWFVWRAKEAKELDPQLLNRASAEYETKQYEKAIDDLDHILSHQPDDANLLLYQGNCFLAVQDWFHAREVFRHVVDRESDHAPARLGLALAEAHLGERRNSLRDAAAAGKAMPAQAEARRSEVEELTKDLANETGEMARKEIEAFEEASADPSVERERLVKLALRAVAASDDWGLALELESPTAEEGRGSNPKKVATNYRNCTSIWEAHARRCGTTLEAGGTGRIRPDSCLMSTLRDQLDFARYSLKHGHPDDARRAVEANFSIEPRIALWDRQTSDGKETVEQILSQSHELLEQMKK